MFAVSMNIIQPQVLPLSSIISQYSSTGIRSPVTRIASSIQNSQDSSVIWKNNEKPEIFPLLNLNEAKLVMTPKLLNKLVFTARMNEHLLPNLSQIRKFSQLLGRRRPPWHESHTSFNSFTENKVGHPSQMSLDSASVFQKIMCGSQNRNLLSVFLTDSKRGFKTQKSIERRTIQAQGTASRFKQGLKLKEGPVTADSETTQRLNSLLSEEASIEEQRNIKGAFTEGYLAGSKTKQKSTWQNIKPLIGRWINISLTVLLLATAIWSIFRMQDSNVHEVEPEEIRVTFEDVRGVQEAKQELLEIVQFLRNPEKFTSLGAELPKGVLLVGPPGTGKTLLARAVAGEAGVPFFYASGPEFDEMFVGQGAKRVRDLFQIAKVKAPCVIFIDEIDSVGAKRSSSVLHPNANQTINQLLSEMDGFHENEGIIVLGATNRRNDLDKALLRPGRFDVEVQVPLPDLAGRKDILEYYLGKVKMGQDVEVNVLGRGTTGFTGADLKNVVNQAALRAAVEQGETVSMKHLEEARDKVLMGPEKKSRIPDEETNLKTAYHESGHTLVAYFTKDSHPLHKVTILPRGSSLGHTAYIPAKEQYDLTRSQMLATIDSLMGGRAAEEIIYGSEFVTSGASSDLKQATNIAVLMVKDLGMSDKVGLRTFENNPNQLFNSDDVLCENTKEAIDTEIKKILQDSYDRAKGILKGHAKELKDLAEALMKYETLDAKDIKSVIEGKPVVKPL